MILWHTEPNAMTSEQTPLPNTIVQSTWEADALPAHYLSALERVREIWVPSSFNAEVFRRQLNVPVYQIPHPIPLQYQQAESVEELNEGLNLKPSDFVVLAIATWQERKNLDGIIEAFLRAFPDEPDAILVLKTRFSLTSPRRRQPLQGDRKPRPGLRRNLAGRQDACADEAGRLLPLAASRRRLVLSAL
jgi:glycosyltransferase involved in cell wall biosynthesis